VQSGALVVSHGNSKAPRGCSRVLDFSFREIAHPYDLLRVEPGQYIRHVPAPVAKEAPKSLAEEIRANRAANAPGGSKGVIKITARGRDGEVQRYSLSSRGARGAGGNGGDEEEGNDGEGAGGGAAGWAADGTKAPGPNAEMEQLLANMRTKVVCDSVRLCDNALAGSEHLLLPVLRNLVVNHYLRVQWLDLSDNKLTAIPADIGQMPLKALHMHGNAVSDWSSLERELPRLKHLQHFTLHGNPISDNAAVFRPRCLGVLLHVREKVLPFKALDYVPLTLADVQGAAAFLRAHPRMVDVTRPSPRKRPQFGSVARDRSFQAESMMTSRRK